MALAKGRSAVRTGPVTLHTQTAIHIAQLMTQVMYPKPTPSPPISTHFCILILSHESTGSWDDIIRSLCPQVLICRSPSISSSVRAWDEAIQSFLYSTAVACSAASDGEPVGALKFLTPTLESYPETSQSQALFQAVLIIFCSF